MTPEQSRKLKTGQRVGWLEDSKDLGTITDTDWSAVQIKWDSGKEHRYHHNDMCDVRLVN